MTTNQKVLAGLGLAAVAYLGYRYFGKDKSDTKIESMSNASGTMCRCDNGFTGRCASGDCNKCCGSYNKQRPEQRRYKF
jgi:hypothetical protein